MSIEWDGKGLPPVGCECEREGPGRWVKCKINYVSETLIVYKMTDSGTEYSSLLNAFMFRPIRTEAERRREDRIKALNGFIGGFMKSASGDYSNLGEALFEWLAILDKVNDTRS
jgi:hypothetical protein